MSRDERQSELCSSIGMRLTRVTSFRHADDFERRNFLAPCLYSENQDFDFIEVAMKELPKEFNMLSSMSWRNSLVILLLALDEIGSIHLISSETFLTSSIWSELHFSREFAFSCVVVKNVLRSLILPYCYFAQYFSHSFRIWVKIIS